MVMDAQASKKRVAGGSLPSSPLPRRRPRQRRSFFKKLRDREFVKGDFPMSRAGIVKVGGQRLPRRRTTLGLSHNKQLILIFKHGFSEADDALDELEYLQLQKQVKVDDDRDEHHNKVWVKRDKKKREEKGKPEGSTSTPARGMRVAVCGVVGSGKSSFLSCILGEIPKLSGEVRISGSSAYVSQSAWI